MILHEGKENRSHATMMTQEPVDDGGEVVVVVPQRTVHMDELFPGAKPLTDSSPSAHKREVF